MDASEEVKAAGGGLSRRSRFLKAATTIAHLCGLLLSGKRYIERSPAVQWATFHLQRQLHFRSDLLFNRSYYSKKQFKKKRFEKLKHLLHNCPKQRRQQDLLQIQECLKTNRAFQCLPIKTQLQLCQVSIYQKYETGTVIVRQGHVATECYLVLSGRLEFMMTDEKTRIFTSETLYEAEEGDFIGETCLLTNTRRPTSALCKSEVEVVVIDKEDFKSILANVWYEKHHATCHFLRKLPLFSTWLTQKIDFLLHCSLQQFYRAPVLLTTTGDANIQVYTCPRNGNSTKSVILSETSNNIDHRSQLPPKIPVLPKENPQVQTHVACPKEHVEGIRVNNNYENKITKAHFILGKCFQIWKSARHPRDVQIVAGTTVVTNSLKSYFLVIVKSGRCIEVAKLDPKQINTQNDTWKTPRCNNGKETSSSAAAQYCSPEGRKDICDLEEKVKQKQRKDGSEAGKRHRKKKAMEAPLAPQFLKIRTLEQSDIFGLADMMDKLCALQLSLISEGAECIFLPKRLFLEGAPAKSRRIALEMLSSYPTESMILENYNVQQVWSTYKTKLIQQQFERHAKPVSINSNSW